jgi:hypothetical protein
MVLFIHEQGTTLMHARLAIALCGTFIGAASALAADPTLAGWNVDFTTARVLRLDPIVTGGGISSDRILFDVHRALDDATGTLSISCVSNDYSLWSVSNGQLLVALEPLSEWPLAAQLAEATCAHIDDLPHADGMMQLDIKAE